MRKCFVHMLYGKNGMISSLMDHFSEQVCARVMLSNIQAWMFEKKVNMARVLQQQFALDFTLTERGQRPTGSKHST